MNERSIESGKQGIAVVLFGLQLTIADLALFADGVSLLVIGAAVIGLLGVVHSFKPLL